MRWRFFVAPVLAVTLAVLPGASAVAAPSEANVKTLVEIYTTLNESHYTHPNEELLLQGAIKGMLQVVGDPFTNYMSPSEYANFMGAVENQYAGIGVVLEPGEDGTLTIAQVYPGTPGEKAGLQAGDVIVAVGETAVTPANVEAMPAQVRGAAGTQVTLQVKRGEAAPVAYVVTRAAIQLPTVNAVDLGGGITYLQIYTFGEKTAQEVSVALAQANKQGVKGLVIDLRSNGGGHVLAALQIADMLLSKGLILTVHDENGLAHPLLADPAAFPAVPVAVLVDQGSASASEMLAGALQQNGRAKLVGSRTFGKGTMQAAEELPNGGYLKVSVDQWVLADGKSPDHVGLTPDVAVASPSLVLPAALQVVQPGPVELVYSRTGAAAVWNGRAVGGAPALVERDGRVFLPLRFTAEALGRSVEWVASAQMASFELGGADVRVFPGLGTVTRNGSPVGAPGDVVSVDGRLYVAASAVAELLGRPVAVQSGSVTVRY